MTTRRQFLTQALVGAGVLGTSPISLFAGKRKNKLENFGYISGILKNELAQGDWKEILRLTVAMGYTEYEGGVQGDSPSEFRTFLKQIGLRYVAGGFGMSDDMDQVRTNLDQLAELGVEYSVIYWPWFVGAPFKLEDCKRSAPILNKIGELASERNLKLCWHNHDKEFLNMENDQLPFDYLMANTSKDLVHVEMDIYWVIKGGADPIDLLRKYPGRVKIMHVKDMKDEVSKDFECPGSGVIDFAPIFAEARKQKILHYFVERDNVTDGIDCLKVSSEYLKKLRF